MGGCHPVTPELPNEAPCPQDCCAGTVKLECFTMSLCVEGLELAQQEYRLDGA